MEAGAEQWMLNGEKKTRERGWEGGGGGEQHDDEGTRGPSSSLDGLLFATFVRLRGGGWRLGAGGWRASGEARARRNCARHVIFYRRHYRGPPFSSLNGASL